MLEGQLVPYAAETEGLELRRIDIDDLSDQARGAVVREVNLRAIPHTRVYRPDGSFVGAVTGADLPAIRVLVERSRDGAGNP